MTFKQFIEQYAKSKGLSMSYPNGWLTDTVVNISVPEESFRAKKCKRHTYFEFLGTCLRYKAVETDGRLTLIK